MYIERVSNRNSPPAVLLRESYREGGRVKKRTLANLSHLSDAIIAGLRRVLRGETVVAPDDAFTIERSRPHGHVAAVLGTLKKLGVDRWLAARRSPERDRAAALIVSRVLAPDSKLATARALDAASATSTLGEMLGLEAVEADDLYAAMDWLGARQAQVEKALARQHLYDGTLVLYDVSSSYLEGRHCPLGRIGHSRDGKKGSLQIVFGLLCNAEGCPVALYVYEGNTGDPTTLKDQIAKVRTRFGLSRVVFVGDRGLLTSAGIREELAPVEGLDWGSGGEARDRAAGRSGAGPLQDGQALRDRDHGHDLPLRAQDGRDHGGGAARRPLRAPHLRREGAARARGHRAGLQGSGQGGAGLPLPQDGGSPRPAPPPPPPGAGACACLPVHARLLRRVAPAAGVGSAALRRGRPAPRRAAPGLARPARGALRERRGQDLHEEDPRRRDRPPLPRPARPPGDAHQEHHPAHGRPAGLRAAQRPHVASAEGLRSARHPDSRVASACTQPACGYSSATETYTRTASELRARDPI